MAAKKKGKPERGSRPPPAKPKRPKAEKRKQAPPPPPALRAPAEAKPKPDRPVVVGVGASAGGLEAFKKFFKALPSESRLAFVLIPHLDPGRDSMMVELLAKHTPLPVVEAKEGMAVEAGRVYIIPPNKFLTIEHGVLRLNTYVATSQGSAVSIDTFFRSLAEDQQERAVGIVLSGTGSHGTLGLKAIKAHGGLALVQDPKTAEYDSMPRSAIAADIADAVLPPEEMPAALVTYTKHMYVNGGLGVAGEQLANPLGQILSLLLVRTKHDFRPYRKGMLRRRIERRMSLAHLESLGDYLNVLRSDPEEVSRLTRDLLISVTTFFRDPEAFAALQKHVLAPLVESKVADEPLRIWVPGCATGEEVYSIVILLMEEMTRQQKGCRLQAFASDVDGAALDLARQGVYLDGVKADIAPERLSRFFTPVGEHAVQINKAVREAVIFGKQNLIQDPPFSKLDLITCRNLLIYLDPEIQEKVLFLLHFSLVEGGYLMLGPSETIGRHVDLFEPLSAKWRIYRRIGTPRREALEIPIAGHVERGEPQRPALPGPALRYGELVHESLLEAHAPPAVLINRKLEVLYFSGATGRYLDHPAGEPTRDLLALAREGLAGKLRAAVGKAIRNHEKVVIGPIPLKHNGGYHTVTATVKPIHGRRAAEEGLLLITFEEVTEPAPSPPPPREPAAEESLVQQLETELQTTRVELQGTIEELRSANEELRASNEEIMSMNEELQSANEELETSKEELQSLNEELNTVNTQLEEKLGELERANNDMANLLDSTDVATIFLDTSFRIKRFTAATRRLLKLIDSDVGRPISDIALRVTDPQLLNDAEQVLRRLTPVEAEVGDADGRCFIRRITPYRTLGNQIDGVVVVFTDVTQVKKALALQERLAAVVMDSNDAVSLLDFGGTITAWNAAAERMYGYSEAEALRMKWLELMPPAEQDDARALLDRLRRGATIHSWESRRLCKDGRILDVWSTLTALKDSAGQPAVIASTERDISERKRYQAKIEEEITARTQELREANETLRQKIAELQRAQHEGQRLTALVESSEDAIIATELDGTISSWNRGAERVYGYTKAEMVGKSIFTLMLPENVADMQRVHKRVRKGEHVEHLEMPRLRKDGRRIIVLISNSPIYGVDGQIAGISSIARDISERVQAQEAVKLSEARFRAVAETAGEAIVTSDSQGQITYVNPAAERIFGYKAPALRGRPVTLLVPERFQETYRHDIERYLGDGSADFDGKTFELSGKRRDGSEFPAELSVATWTTRDGPSFTGIIRDITERKHLERRVLESVIEEQRRIGQDLHDTAGQELTGLVLIAQTLTDSVRGQSVHDAVLATKVTEGLRRALSQVRNLARGLVPVEVHAGGLMAALEDLAGRTASFHNIACVFHCTVAVPVKDNLTASHLFCIAQEAVSNALKHGHAKHIQIALETGAGAIALTVTDDGSGIKGRSDSTSGMGLQIMRYRAQILNAVMNIEPVKPHGTRVTCTLLQGDADAAEQDESN